MRYRRTELTRAEWKFFWRKLRCVKKLSRYWTVAAVEREMWYGSTGGPSVLLETDGTDPHPIGLEYWIDYNRGTEC